MTTTIRLRCRAAIWPPDGRGGHYQCHSAAKAERELMVSGGRLELMPVCGTHLNKRARAPSAYWRGPSNPFSPEAQEYLP
jgi:hypothetical protein